MTSTATAINTHISRTLEVLSAVPTVMHRSTSDLIPFGGRDCYLGTQGEFSGFCKVTQVPHLNHCPGSNLCDQLPMLCSNEHSLRK